MYSETTRVVKRYFKGAFTYYLPSDYESRNKVEEAAFYLDKILGLQLTPEVLWNLTPWSWAADWVGNFGDVLANVSDYATDGLVLRYGYMMEHSISKVTYTIPDIPALGGRTLTQTHFREVKKRVPATPFGFGLTFDSFSTKQKAILAALGITKVR
jgi:peptidoglycan/xylan/chitin deacetylase (PgdA/CDA1 family)